MKYRIEVSLKSFEHDFLVRATQQIQQSIPCELSNLKSGSVAPKVNIFYFPTQFQKFTVLRSPHIDKKARDQFEIRRFKNSIGFDIDSSLGSRAVLVFLENLKNIQCPGVQIHMKISSSSYGPSLPNLNT